MPRNLGRYSSASGCCRPQQGELNMKRLIASAIATALVASPALSQPTSTTQVKTTTKTAHVEGTVSKPTRHVTKRHHVVRCGCPHAYKPNHKTVTKTTTTTTKS